MVLHIDLSQHVSCGFLNRKCTYVNKGQRKWITWIGNRKEKVWALRILYNDEGDSVRFRKHSASWEDTWPWAPFMRGGGRWLRNRKSKALNACTQRSINDSSSLSFSLSVSLTCSHFDLSWQLRSNKEDIYIYVFITKVFCLFIWYTIAPTF